VTRKKTARKNGRAKSRRRGALLALKISRGHVFLAVFFRVTHDGLSERGTTRSLVRVGVGAILSDFITWGPKHSFLCVPGKGKLWHGEHWTKHCYLSDLFYNTFPFNQSSKIIFNLQKERLPFYANGLFIVDFADSFCFLLFFHRCWWFHWFFRPATSYKIPIFLRVFGSSVRLRGIGTSAFIFSTDIIYFKAVF